jgi:DNA (cytosine-5)-methyltransferase 1
MAEGSMGSCPIWDDLESFDGRAYRDRVDLVVAGFPCQGASVAGKRRGTADERWLWPLVWRTIIDCGASMLFVENVPGLLNVNGGAAFAEIVDALAARGWIAEWDCIPAAAVGAPHIRDRVFLLAADPDGVGSQSIGHVGQLDEGERPEHRDDLDRCNVSPGWARVVGRVAPESSFRGMDDGVAVELERDWHERLHLLGSGVVPQAAARAWSVLSGRLLT